jgi:hypothetical protein
MGVEGRLWMQAGCLVSTELPGYGQGRMTIEAPKRPRKPRVRKSKDHVAVRLEPELVVKIDALAKELATEWHQAKRSDALRLVIIRGLKAHEEDKAKQGSKGTLDSTTRATGSLGVDRRGEAF